MSDDTKGEPTKWNISPQATLAEFVAGRHDDPDDLRTICGVQRHLWLLINVDLNGYIPQEKLDQINAMLERAFRMGKRMDHRLQRYYYEVNGVPPEIAEKHAQDGKFVSPVDYRGAEKSLLPPKHPVDVRLTGLVRKTKKGDKGKK